MLQAQHIINMGLELGFDAIACCNAELDAQDKSAFLQWLADKSDAGMDYLRTTAVIRAQGVKALESWAEGVVIVAQSYNEPTRARLPSPSIARYAIRKDYHSVLHRRLAVLGRALRRHDPALMWRVVVDTAPLLERAYAHKAGLGWIGNNSMLLSRQLGSYTVLGALVVNLELDQQSSLQLDAMASCGTCTACMDACPAHAITSPCVLDARRCISYWNIEHRGAFDCSLDLNSWLFGCDRCQEVCPINKQTHTTSRRPILTRPEFVDANWHDILNGDQTLAEKLLAGTPLRRAGFDGLRRNLERIESNSG